MLRSRLYRATEIRLGNLKKTRNSHPQDSLFTSQHTLGMLLISVSTTLTCRTLVLNTAYDVLLDDIPAPDTVYIILYYIILYYFIL